MKLQLTSESEQHADILLYIAEDVDDLMLWDWASLEAFIIELSPISRLCVSLEKQKTFKELLRGVIDGGILERLHSLGRLDLRHYSQSYYAKDNAKWYMIGGYVGLRDVLSYPTRVTLGDVSILILPEDRFALILCTNDDERLEYLHKLVEKRDQYVISNGA